MSKYSDFLTMKLIERERQFSNYGTETISYHALQDSTYVKNLNVRTKIDLIARVETLAEFTGVSKAQLVTEILESAILEAIDKLEERGQRDDYDYQYLKNMESNYGFTLIYDDEGIPINIDIENTGKESK